MGAFLLGGSMAQEKHRIYGVLTQEDGIREIIKSLYRNPVEKYGLAALTILVILFFASLWFEVSKKWSATILILLAIAYLFYMLASFVTNLRFILSPVKSYITNLTKKLESEEIVLKRLINENVTDLEAVKIRLEFERNQLNLKVGFLLGAIDKLGIIPAALALYTVYAKAVNDKLLPKTLEIVFAFFVGLYLGTFVVKHVIDRFSHMIFIIEQAIKDSKRKVKIETKS
jgi:hypothetical protein